MNFTMGPAHNQDPLRGSGLAPWPPVTSGYVALPLCRLLQILPQGAPLPGDFLLAALQVTQSPSRS